MLNQKRLFPKSSWLYIGGSECERHHARSEKAIVEKIRKPTISLMFFIFGKLPISLAVKRGVVIIFSAILAILG